MTKLAIIDLDGVVADNTSRFAKAEEAKQAREKEIELTGMTEAQIQRECISLYWQTAFDPALVSLDTLIDGVYEAIASLENYGYKVIFLTSRPESMREATRHWFWAHLEDFLYGDNLIMKAPAFQYVKTVVWKAGMVQTLAMLYGADEVLFIDDEAANAAEVMNHAEAVEYRIRVCSSLQKAVEAQS